MQKVGMKWLSTEETVEQEFILPMLTNKIFLLSAKHCCPQRGEADQKTLEKKNCSPSFICTQDKQSQIVLVCVATTLLNLLYVALFL